MRVKEKIVTDITVEKLSEQNIISTGSLL